MWERSTEFRMMTTGIVMQIWHPSPVPNPGIRNGRPGASGIDAASRSGFPWKKDLCSTFWPGMDVSGM